MYDYRFWSVFADSLLLQVSIVPLPAILPPAQDPSLHGQRNSFNGCMRNFAHAKKLHVLMQVWLCLQLYTRTQKLSCRVQMKSRWISRSLGANYSCCCARSRFCTGSQDCSLSRRHSSLASPLTSPSHDHFPIKTSPKALLPDQEMWNVFVCRILLPAMCLGTGPGSQVIESCPDAEVWEIKHLGYIIMMKGHWSKLLVYGLLKPQFPLTFSEGKMRQQP